MLPGLPQLEATADVFRLLLDGLTEGEANWKPSPQRWSIAEVMEHLSHVEGHGFRARIDQMVGQDVATGEMPELKEYDQEAFSAAGQYSGRGFEDSFAHWEEQRETNIEYLRTLNAAAASRQGMHERFGIISVADLMNEWAFHDLGHIRQVIELVRAQRYYPNMGAFQSIYTICP